VTNPDRAPEGRVYPLVAYPRFRLRELRPGALEVCLGAVELRLRDRLLVEQLAVAFKEDLREFEGREVVTVPETAVTYSLQGNIVYVIAPDAEGSLTAVSRIVEVGETRAGRTAILDNLEPGERVASVGQNKLYRGVKVIIDEKVDL